MQQCSYRSQTTVVHHMQENARTLVVRLRPSPGNISRLIHDTVDQTQQRVLTRFNQILRSLDMNYVFEEIRKSTRPEALEQMMVLDLMGEAVNSVFQEMQQNGEIKPEDESEWKNIKANFFRETQPMADSLKRNANPKHSAYEPKFNDVQPTFAQRNIYQSSTGISVPIDQNPFKQTGRHPDRNAGQGITHHTQQRAVSPQPEQNFPVGGNPAENNNYSQNPCNTTSFWNTDNRAPMTSTGPNSFNYAQPNDKPLPDQSRVNLYPTTTAFAQTTYPSTAPGPTGPEQGKPQTFSLI